MTQRNPLIVQNGRCAPGWRWQWQIFAPVGGAIPGACGETRSAAIASLFPDPKIWPYALNNGYSARAVQVEIERAA